VTEKISNPSRKWPFVLASCGLGLAIAFCIGFFLYSTAKELFVFVEPNESGLILSPYEPTGYRSELLTPGLHFLIPGEKPFIYDIIHQTYVMGTNTLGGPDFIEAKSSDGKKLQIDISVTYAVDPEKVLDLYKKWRDNYKESLVRPMSRGTTRDVIAQYKLNEALTKRDEVGQMIFDQLAPVLAENYLILWEVDVLDIRPINE
jgi:regulator of protease activity HflC (stomatin/prohibitin superfamily)